MTGKILVVDDEPHMRRVIELSLKKCGCPILTAQDGREALQIAAREQPSLIVMDVTMPEMDGITALKLLKASPVTAGIPVIMLTTRGRTLTQAEAENSGAALYVTKPFSPSALAAEASRLLQTAGSPPPPSTA